MTFEVRPATVADEMPFLDLVELLFEPPGGRPQGYTERGSRLPRCHRGTNSDVLLAYDGDALVELARCTAISCPVRFGQRCWLQDLVTDSSQRSRGVGATLLGAAGEWARAHGCTHLELTSGLGRVDAHRFYEREGMTRAAYSFFVWLD
jgi:GNAT superfamily N-acetyltransferase